ncbi:hypothetical protein C4D60_Mb08t32340 [Musa balbisiana]|uniref:Uncharacterized protein n=1 Tax=Musa balbisiana TaxID=52838 RepID=A0A4V4H9D1_MUSBA|nr:hypothetical protein C4D60_Mb08t32340 [Musa balbisiana]
MAVHYILLFALYRVYCDLIFGVLLFWSKGKQIPTLGRVRGLKQLAKLVFVKEDGNRPDQNYIFDNDIVMVQAS